MAYIGNEPTSVAFLTDTFSGNGSTTAFTLSAAPAGTSSILVAITGVVQDPTTYSTTGTTLTFSAAPPSGTGNISVRFLGIPASGVTTTAYRTVTEFTATAGQTTFNTPSYTPGFIDVYRNGVMLGSADYTASNGVSVVLASGATAGDLVEVISFSVSSVLNAMPTTGGTFSGNVLFAGGNGIWNTSSNVGIGTTSPTQSITGGASRTLQLQGPSATVTVLRVNEAGGTYGDFQAAVVGSSEVIVGNIANGAMRFLTNNTERMRVNAGAPILCLAGGNTTATGTGIAFPATQSTSSDANTLDDYEEGTFTPALFTDSGSATAGGQTCNYTKIGNIVNVSGSFNVSSVSSPGGLLRVTNLPFTTSTVGVNGAGGAVSVFNTASSYSSYTPWAYTINGLAQFYIRYTTGTAIIEGAALLKTGTEIWFNVTYRAA